MHYFKLIIALGAAAFITFACNNTTKKSIADKTEIHPKLVKEWESDSVLTTCESVLYDKASGILYVANINQKPWELDNNGFISTMNTKGEIIDLKWAEGLSGPKGMGIANGKLYVNDINQLVEIDIKTRKIVNSYLVNGKPDLNDISVAADGTVYASGSGSETIYALKNNKLDTCYTGKLERLNGLLCQPEGIYYATSKNHEFGLFDLEKKEVKILNAEVGHGDGIVRLPNGDFIVSSWKGEIFYIAAKDWKKTTLLDTRESGINTADIEFIPELNLLLVPTFFNNRVIAYKLHL